MGLPQDKLGVMIGLDEGSSSARISRYETGVHEPAFNIACKLAQALQVPQSTLVQRGEVLWQRYTERAAQMQQIQQALQQERGLAAIGG